MWLESRNIRHNCGVNTPNIGLSTNELGIRHTAGIACPPNAGIATYTYNAGVSTYSDTSGISTVSGYADNLVSQPTAKRYRHLQLSLELRNLRKRQVSHLRI